MLRLIAVRLALSVVLILVSSATIFILMSFVPGDPARTILGEFATPEAIERLREQMGLNQPLSQQYANWLLGLLRGDLGTSIYNGETVTKLINSRLPVTISLIVLSTVMIAVVGGTLGLLSAYRGGWLGRSIDALAMAGLALPGFWVAIVLVATFAVAIRIFPATGFVPITSSPAGWIQSMTLPTIALSLGGVTLVAKQMRNSALDVLGKDYIRVLRANGVRESAILFTHVLRNASVPSMTVLGLTVLGTLTGAVFIENVFVLPGLGTLVTNATLKHDLPVILGVGVFFTCVVIVVNLVVDITYGVLNPKVRVQ